MNMRRMALAAAALAALTGVAMGAGLFPGLPTVGGASYCGGSSVAGVPGSAPVCNNTVPAGPSVLTGSELVPADTALSQGQAPQTVTIPSALLANLSGLPKNYVDNGSMNVQQYGTSAITCAQAAGSTQATYGPDRWTCSGNVTSGAGRSQVITTSSLLPTGFANLQSIWRNSGSLAQPVCAIQELSTNESTALAGKQVTLSFYAGALAGLAADNNSVINAYVITGTGTAQGLGTMTASPAITPAWTGIATPLSSPFTITTAPVRYSVTGVIPTTTTEAGVELCFTPTTTSTGRRTDGLAFTGVQLEVAPSPTAYEFHSYYYDLEKAQHYYWQWAETVSTTNDSPFLCSAQSATVAICKAVVHSQLRAAPTVACTPGTMKRQVAGTDTAVSACAAAATTNGISGIDAVSITATVASGDTAGLSGSLMSGNSTGGGKITAWSDF